MTSESSKSSQGPSSSYAPPVGNSESPSADCMLIRTGWYLPDFSPVSSQSGQSSSGLSVLLPFSSSFSWLKPLKGRAVFLCRTGQNQTWNKMNIVCMIKKTFFDLNQGCRTCPESGQCSRSHMLMGYNCVHWFAVMG